VSAQGQAYFLEVVGEYEADNINLVRNTPINVVATSEAT